MAYDVFVKARYEVDFVSPEGGAIPIGYINTSNKIQKEYLFDADFMRLLKHTYSPSAIDPSNYKLVYYSEWGAAIFGVPEKEKIQRIATEIYNSNGIISAICHGTAGIVNLRDEQENPLYQNKKISGYPDFIRKQGCSILPDFPFFNRATIRKNRGKFMYSLLIVNRASYHHMNMFQYYLL